MYADFQAGIPNIELVLRIDLASGWRPIPLWGT